MAERQTFLVVGATGKQGGAVIDALQRESSSFDGYTAIRFLTRNPSSASSIRLLKRSCNAYKGDLSDAESLDRALHGVDACYLVTDPLGKGGVEAEVENGRRFVDAAARAGVKHIVFSSVYSADKAASVPHFASKWKIEQAIEASGMSYTILRPVAFMDNFGVQPGWYRFLTNGSLYALAAWKPHALIAVQDIGQIAAQALLDPTNPEYKNARILLSAGEYSYTRTLDEYERAQGHRPWIASWFPPWLVYALPDTLKKMMLFIREEGYPAIDTEHLRQLHPGLLSVRDWVAQNSKDKTA